MDLVDRDEVIKIICKDCCNDSKAWCGEGVECECVKAIKHLQNPLEDDGK